MTRQEAIEIAKKMIKIYEKRGGGYSQKLALQLLIDIASKKPKTPKDILIYVALNGRKGTEGKYNERVVLQALFELDNYYVPPSVDEINKVIRKEENCDWIDEEHTRGLCTTKDLAQAIHILITKKRKGENNA